MFIYKNTIRKIKTLDFLDFEYSLPFEYMIPLGCPSSFEGSDAFVRYFARVTFQTAESNTVSDTNTKFCATSKKSSFFFQPIYIAKRHFSVYSLETTAAVDTIYEAPYTYRHTFASGGCCCRRQVYFELVMPKRFFYAGDDIEARMIIDNVPDERIANEVGWFLLLLRFVEKTHTHTFNHTKYLQIAWSIVERTTRADILDDDAALKAPARVLSSGKVDGTNVEKRKNQITIGSIRIPRAVPLTLANAAGEQKKKKKEKIKDSNRLFTHFKYFFCLAMATLPQKKSSPPLSPNDQASKLFEHPLVISTARKEPIFRIHYALQAS